MNGQLKKIAKDLGYRGWRFEIEGEDRFFITKFDPIEKNNDDEYRVYFFIKPEGIQFTRRFVIEKYKFDERVSLTSENKYIAEAEKILITYFETCIKPNLAYGFAS